MRLGNELAVLVGCIDINSEGRLECLRFQSNKYICLRNVSAWDLTKADFEDGVISMPVADSPWSGQPFFPKSPEEAFKDGDFDTAVSCRKIFLVLLHFHSCMSYRLFDIITSHQVDVLLGSNQHEGLLITQVFHHGSSLRQCKGWFSFN